MSRVLTAAVQSELAADSVRLAHLVRVSLDSAPVLMTDSYRSIEHDGQTYLALGHLMAIDAIAETSRLLIGDTRITLSAVDQSLLSLFLGEEYVNRKATIWLAVLGSADVLIADPIKILDGRLDDPQIEEDPDSGTSTISARITNQWADFSRRAGRVTNNASQQSIFSSDRGFEHTAKTLKPVVWGRATGSSSSSGSGGGAFAQVVRAI